MEQFFVKKYLGFDFSIVILLTLARRKIKNLNKQGETRKEKTSVGFESGKEFG